MIVLYTYSNAYFYFAPPLMSWKESLMERVRFSSNKMLLFQLMTAILSPPADRLRWSFMSISAMSVLPPIRKDRVIARLPQVTSREKEERLTVKVGFCSHTSVVLSFSVSGKMQLCTQRRILTTKSRQPVRSSVLEPWGEDRADWWGGGLI